MRSEHVRRLVAVSTFSVYDYLRQRQGSLLTEKARLERKPEARDEYARTKLIQEELIRDFEKEHGGQVTILRPGVIFGQDHTWTARLGADLGKRWIRIGANAALPLVYVENCAEAIVIACQTDGAIGQTINLVDNETPAQRRYMAELHHRDQLDGDAPGGADGGGVQPLPLRRQGQAAGHPRARTIARAVQTAALQQRAHEGSARLHAAVRA
jgi:nucleoside-diphosphate-sugar epimerase